MEVIVTSYVNPDIDGVSCSIAYANLLRANGTDAKHCICGKPNREAMFVLNRFDVKSEVCESFIGKKVIVVDMSKPEDLCQKIDPSDVIGLIDHRQYSKLAPFSNAKIQIELVGSCATLIAEKYRKESIILEKDIASLLYSAIISNTINFKANVTTKRDHEMAKWLNKTCLLEKEYIDEMFRHKSHIDGDLKKVFESDFSVYDEYGLGIAQLEIIDSSIFVKKNTVEIKLALEKIKSERKLKLIFLTIIDIKESFNQFVCTDKKTRSFLSPLNIEFDGDLGQRKGILMRKEIIPLIRKSQVSTDSNL